MRQADVTTRAMTPRDAGAVHRLMRRCYGETYFDDLYYDPDALARAIANEQQHSAIAVDAAGEAVAHLGLRRPPGSRTADSSMGLVAPRYRERGLMVEMGIALAPFFRSLDLCGLWLQAVTVHPYTQRASLKGGSGVTGIELGYIPRGTTFLDVDSAITETATPALILYQPLQEAPRREIHVPTRYRDVACDAMAGCRLDREVVDATETSSADAETRVRSIVKARQGVCYLWLDAAGDDAAERVAGLAGEREAAGTRAVYLNLPLDGVASDALVSQLRKHRFSYAGVLPEYAGRDWLTLQRVSGECLEVDDIVLTNDESWQLLDFVMRDRVD